MNKQELEALDDRGVSAWDQHDANAFLELLDDTFEWLDTTQPVPIRDRQGASEFFEGWVRAFPDLRFSRLNRIVGDDAVAGELQWEGTNTGPLTMGEMEIPPTNNRVVSRTAYFVRLRDGKITEFRTYNDVLAMMAQLGLAEVMAHEEEQVTVDLRSRQSEEASSTR